VRTAACYRSIVQNIEAGAGVSGDPNPSGSADGNPDAAATQRPAEPDTGKSRPRYPLTSVGNALELLMMFREFDEVRVSDVSTRLQVANSTAHRLLAMLTYHELVQQTESRVYVAGLALLEVGLAVLNSMDVRVHARSYLLELHEAFGETVHLAELAGRNVHFLDAIEGTHTLRVAQRIDEVLPAHCTSVGKALLAQLDPGELDQILPDDALIGLTDKSITTRGQLDVELEAVRSLGYATSDGESEEGISSVAVALPSPTGPIAAISIAAPANRMSARRRREIGQALLDTADRFAAVSRS
jgi:IclR family acetate operon transcriptional repressor